ncbi:MAG: FAD:protein FMN transferase [Alphaproteobacteria bacterium]|nr:FAD:protein FMN transferase [Alphaproteobacteria bacterium]
MLGAWLAGCGAPVAAPPGDATSASDATPAYQQLEGEALGTSWHVQWSAAPRATAAAVEVAVVDALRQVDEAMSTWRDDSDLARVRAGHGPVVVREETADVVRAGLALAEATGGAFDPTVQPLVELWGFHGAPRTTWPTDAELDAARAQVGWDRVGLGRDGQGLPVVDAAGTALDLSAIAKGHAVDRVGLALSALGVADWFVEVGGEVRAAGASPRGTPWRVGIDAPNGAHDPGAELVATVDLANAALATSGNYRQRYRVDGREVHHTLDPRTGLPAASPVLSASVVAPDCQTADGWATALMVLGPEQGLPLIEARPELDAWLVVEDGRGRRAVASSGMNRWLATSTLGPLTHGDVPPDAPAAAVSQPPSAAGDAATP